MGSESGVGATATLPAHIGSPTPLLMRNRLSASQPHRTTRNRPRTGPRALSASRISIARQCHRLYGFRYLDHVEEAKSASSARGALLHKVLEDLFTWEPQARTLTAATDHIRVAWGAVIEAEPEYLVHCGDDAQVETMVGEVTALLAVYFSVEDPTVLTDTLQEVPFEVTHGGVPLVGVVDRIDVHPGTGAERITDYKAGRPPAERFVADRLFQVKMYGLARYVQTGRLPALVRVMFLGGDSDIDPDRRVLEWIPTEAGLRIVAQRLGWAWNEVSALHREGGDRSPHQQTLCTWCPFLNLCPEGQQAAADYLRAKGERESAECA